MINLKGLEENYEVQFTVNTKGLEWFCSRYDLGGFGISVEPAEPNCFTVRVQLSTGLSHLFIAAAAPNFSQVISWEDFAGWDEDTFKTLDRNASTTFIGVVTLYWLERCATSYLQSADSVFSARLGVSHGS
jgi:hypothetical protein